MDIDELIRSGYNSQLASCFSPLMDIDELIPTENDNTLTPCFSPLMDIDELILPTVADIRL